MFRLNDTLMTVPNETRMIVRLGRALKSGEFRIRLFLLRMKEVEVCGCVCVCAGVCVDVCVCVCACAES